MKHDVTFEVPKRPLGRADIKFIVRRDSSIIGTLAISNGALVWFPKGTTYGYKMGWRRFNETMKANATRAERRPTKTGRH